MIKKGWDLRGRVRDQEVAQEGERFLSWDARVQHPPPLHHDHLFLRLTAVTKLVICEIQSFWSFFLFAGWRYAPPHSTLTAPWTSHLHRATVFRVQDSVWEVEVWGLNVLGLRVAEQESEKEIARERKRARERDACVQHPTPLLHHHPFLRLKSVTGRARFWPRLPGQSL